MSSVELTIDSQLHGRRCQPKETLTSCVSILVAHTGSVSFSSPPSAKTSRREPHHHLNPMHVNIHAYSHNSHSWQPQPAPGCWAGAPRSSWSRPKNPSRHWRFDERKGCQWFGNDSVLKSSWSCQTLKLNSIDGSKATSWLHGCPKWETSVSPEWPCVPVSRSSRSTVGREVRKFPKLGKSLSKYVRLHAEVCTVPSVIPPSHSKRPSRKDMLF